LREALAIEAMCALDDVPPVVAAPFDDAHFFPKSFSGVAGVKGMRVHVEGESIGVAKTVGIDLRRPGVVHPRSADKWVVGRNCIGPPVIHVNAQDASEEVRAILTVAETGGMSRTDIASAAAVAKRHIEILVGRPERQHAAVVIGLWLI